jgi:hypothetical protein
MKLNRAHALLLVGTLAAGACVTETSDDDSGGRSGSGGRAGKGGSAGKGAAGSSSAGKSSGGMSGAGAEAGGRGGMSEAGAPSEGGMAGSVVEGGGEGGSVAEGGSPSVSGAGGEGGAECNDSLANELTCDDLDTSSCGIQSFLDAECAMTWKNMKPSISNVARNCMLELSQAELCDDGTNAYHCIDQALHDACPDAAVVPLCAEILATTSCGSTTGVTAETCQLYLSGLTQNGRDEMVSCLESDCDFYSCAEGLN